MLAIIDRVDEVRRAVLDIVHGATDARFFEKLRNRKADRLMVISPMVDLRAMDLAARRDMKVVAGAESVDAKDLGLSF